MKTYKCFDCRKTFRAQEDVDNCPYCGSDNISPSRNVSRYWGLVTLFVFFVFAGFFLTKMIADKQDNSVTTHEVKQETPVSGGNNQIRNNVSPNILPPPVSVPEIVNVSALQYEKDGYNFVVEAAVASGHPLEFFLFRDNDVIPVYSSDTGRFINVAWIEGGIYLLKVVNTETNEYAEMYVDGFIAPPVQPIKKLTKAQLQDIINKQNPPKGFYLNFADHYKLKFKGLDPNEPKLDRFDEIFNRLVGTWDSAIVSDIQYDDLNKIVSVTIEVVY